VLLTVSVNQRLGEIAALRAVGLSRSRVVAGVLWESVMLVGAGGLLALPLGAALSIWLDGILRSLPEIPSDLHFFVFQPRALVLHVLLLAAAAIAAAIHLRSAPLNARRQESGEVLGRHCPVHPDRRMHIAEPHDSGRDRHDCAAAFGRQLRGILHIEIPGEAPACNRQGHQRGPQTAPAAWRRFARRNDGGSRLRGRLRLRAARRGYTIRVR